GVLRLSRAGGRRARTVESGDGRRDEGCCHRRASDAHRARVETHSAYRRIPDAGRIATDLGEESGRSTKRGTGGEKSRRSRGGEERSSLGPPHGRLELLQLLQRNRRIFLEKTRGASAGLTAGLGDHGELAKSGRAAFGCAEGNRPRVRELPEVAARRGAAAEKPCLLHRRGAGGGGGRDGSGGGCCPGCEAARFGARGSLPRRSKRIFPKERGEDAGIGKADGGREAGAGAARGGNRGCT